MYNRLSGYLYSNTFQFTEVSGIINSSLFLSNTLISFSAISCAELNLEYFNVAPCIPSSTPTATTTL